MFSFLFNSLFLSRCCCQSNVWTCRHCFWQCCFFFPECFSSRALSNISDSHVGLTWIFRLLRVESCFKLQLNLSTNTLTIFFCTRYQTLSKCSSEITFFPLIALQQLPVWLKTLTRSSSVSIGFSILNYCTKVMMMFLLTVKIYAKSFTAQFIISHATLVCTRNKNIKTLIHCSLQVVALLYWLRVRSFGTILAILIPV